MKLELPTLQVDVREIHGNDIDIPRILDGITGNRTRREFRCVSALGKALLPTLGDKYLNRKNNYGTRGAIKVEYLSLFQRARELGYDLHPDWGVFLNDYLERVSVTFGLPQELQHEPVFIHDCQECKFLRVAATSDYGVVDVYVCRGALGESLILRYGDDGPAYVSSPIKVLKSLPHVDLTKMFEEVFPQLCADCHYKTADEDSKCADCVCGERYERANHE